MMYDPLNTRTLRPSPAVSFIGRKNSGKTTLVEGVIARLHAHGLNVASIKHHGHPNFEIDVPGKDSYRHRQAGAGTTAILSSNRFALIEDLQDEMTCLDALALMPGRDIVVVEGYREAGLPAIELFRAANERDAQAAPAFCETLRAAAKAQNTQKHPAVYTLGDSSINGEPDNPALPVAVVTDIEAVAACAQEAHVPVFRFDAIEDIANFVIKRFSRQPLTIAIQAGGESKRMGQSKARTPFLGRPLIEHMLDLLIPFGDEIVITTNEPERLAYLLELHPHLKLERDVCDERGALPGLLTALHHSSNDATAVVACDMIALSPRILGLEALVLQSTRHDAVVPYNQGYWEPFAGVYRASTCEPALERELARGSKRMQDLFEHISCLPFDSSPWQQRGSINPFANVNTPQELAQAEVLYRLYG